MNLAYKKNIFKGKRDFILFEALDDAVSERKRLVIVTPLGSGRAALGFLKS